MRVWHSLEEIIKLNLRWIFAYKIKTCQWIPLKIFTIMVLKACQNFYFYRYYVVKHGARLRGGEWCCWYGDIFHFDLVLKYYYDFFYTIYKYYIHVKFVFDQNLKRFFSRNCIRNKFVHKLFVLCCVERFLVSLVPTNGRI